VQRCSPGHSQCGNGYACDIDGFCRLASKDHPLPVPCGGSDTRPCPGDNICIPRNGDECAGTFCHGLCTLAPGTCGGMTNKPCAEGGLCVYESSCDPSKGDRDCIGVCVEKPRYCGGKLGETCPDGFSCLDDPTCTCPCGTCPKICAPLCGGQVDIACPKGYRCVFPSDPPCFDCYGTCVVGV
jgi:hypothetical protein